jgi:hypothetical protein
MTAVSPLKTKQRIYLAKVTGDVTSPTTPDRSGRRSRWWARPTSTRLPRDPAGNQVFVLQALPDEATTLAIDFR